MQERGYPVANLYALRQAAQISPARIATICDCHVNTYLRWERGQQNPRTWRQVQRLAKAFRVSVATLQGRAYAHP